VRKAVLIYNPRAGRWRAAARLEAIVAALADSGFSSEAVPTEGPGDATRIAGAAVRAGVGVVFSLGGDGTLRETAAGLLGSDTAMGPLPAGTANVIARDLGLPLDPLRAARAFGRAAVRPHRVGLCANEPFLMQASTGLDARVLAAVRPAAKRILGEAAVALAALREWWRYDYPEIRLTAAGRGHRAGFCAACMMPRYGPFRLAPQGDDDHRFPLVLFAGRGRAVTLSFALDLARGRHLERPDVHVEQVDSLEIREAPGLPIQLDGCVTDLEPPVRIRLAPAGLAILAPRAPRAGARGRGVD
jgi:diacylglycerol kinase (ATP)